MVWRRRYDPKCVGAGTSENLQGLQGVLDSGLGGTSKRQRGAHAAQPFMPLRDAGAELDEVPQWLQEEILSKIIPVKFSMFPRILMRC